MQTSMKNVLPLPIDEYHSLFLKSMFRKYALSTDSSWSMHISLNHEMILIAFYFSLNSDQKFRGSADSIAEKWWKSDYQGF